MPAQVYAQADTVPNIITDAAMELGLVSSAISSPYTSTDQNILLLTKLLKNLGRELWRLHDWSHLTLETSISTSAGVDYYSLPTGFGRIVDGSAWNRTSSQQLGGPLTPQEWQALKGTSSTTTSPLWFRIYQGRFWLSSGASTPASTSIYYEYVSNLWVVPTGQTVPTLSAPTAATDTIWFDPHLVKLGLKLRFKEAKGFDSSAEMRDFQHCLEQLKSEDKPSPRLSLVPRDDAGLLTSRNLPYTGYG